MNIFYSNDQIKNLEDIQIGYNYASFTEGIISEDWEKAFGLLYPNTEIDAIRIELPPAQTYSSFCDLLSLDFDNIANGAQALILKHWEITGEKEGGKDPDILAALFCLLAKEHVLLADPELVEKMIHDVNCENYREYRKKSNHVSYVIFSLFILLKKYVDHLIAGDKRLANKNIWMSYSAKYLSCNLPFLYPPGPMAGSFDGRLVSEEQEIHNNFQIFLNSIENISPIDLDYFCTDSGQFLTASLYSILENHLSIKRCRNCGKYFVPLTRSDSIYCDRSSPQDIARTCKEYGSQRLWYDRLKDDEASKLARNVYMAKQMLVRRNPDIEAYKVMFEYFKAERKVWEHAVKSNLKTREEYLDWLNGIKTRKIL